MIEKVTVSNVYGRHLDLELRHPEKSGYAVTSITGIEPMDVDIKTTQFVSGKKFRYNAGFHKLRTINITIIFYEYNNGNKSIQTLRTDLYKYFLTNGEVTLTFLKDNQYYSIKGVVDKNAPTIFSQQTGATISVTCPELWFYLSDENGNAIVTTGSRSGDVLNGILRWNQLDRFNNITQYIGTNVLVKNNGDGSFSLNGTALSNANFIVTRDNKATTISGHKYLAYSNIFEPNQNNVCGGIYVNNDSVMFENNENGIIYTATNSGQTISSGFHVNGGSSVNLTKATTILTDLTLMFGAGNEPQTADEFKSILSLQKDAYPYDPGSDMIVYNGDFETGFITEVANVNNVDVHVDTKINETTWGAIKVSPKNLETDQPLYISTENFGLDVYTIDDGAYTNRINFLDASAMSDRTPLPILREADNIIDIYYYSGTTKNTLSYTIRYNTLYRGL